jgi:hypothetical protein
MERTVPSTASDEIDLYQRTYYSLLRSTSEVQIRTLEEAHTRIRSLLHPASRDPSPDMSAFVYCTLRLPACMPKVQMVVMGQNTSVFARRGFGNVESWEQVVAPARRRRWFFNGKDTLACYIASRTDIDDLIPILTAYQIEWNKIHSLLQLLPEDVMLSEYVHDLDALRKIAQVLRISLDDLSQLRLIWGAQFTQNMRAIAARPLRLKIQLLSSSLIEYWRATRIWWENIQRGFPQLQDCPVYFVSSNPHSVVNLLSGFALHHKDELIEFLQKPGNEGLWREWKEIVEDRVPSSQENFLYYVLKKFQQVNDDPESQALFEKHEHQCGIVRIPSEHIFDVEAQVIELRNINPEWIDPRLDGDNTFLKNSDAFILNIDYPLGLAAYNILSKVAEHVGEVLGVYVTGKAATLNGVIGDIMIPNVVHDEQSHNTYLFPNAFTATQVAPYVVYSTVLDNQKAVTVRGTFLQNSNYMDVFYREGYTDIEMEAGPYLSAIYEMYRPQRHPINEVVNLYGLPFDLGILHYASDTPLSKGRNLGAGSLSYFGMDSTYGVSLAILRRIFQLEKDRLQDQRSPRG